MIANDITNVPSYAAVSFTGDSITTWAASTTDPRGLQTSSGASTRVASAYYSSATLTINVDLTDNATHQISLYLVDWGKTGRSERISVVDAASRTVLSTQTLSSFNNGIDTIWNVKGHVLINVQAIGSTNSLASAVFFDP